MLTVEQSGWFYLPTYLKDDKYEPKTDTCTLLVRHIERVATAGGSRVRIRSDALEFSDEDAMVEWIDEHDAQELPSEAEGNPRYVPASFEQTSNPATVQDREPVVSEGEFSRRPEVRSATDTGKPGGAAASSPAKEPLDDMDPRIIGNQIPAIERGEDPGEDIREPDDPELRASQRRIMEERGFPIPDWKPDVPSPASEPS